MRNPNGLKFFTVGQVFARLSLPELLLCLGDFPSILTQAGSGAVSGWVAANDVSLLLDFFTNFAEGLLISV